MISLWALVPESDVEAYAATLVLPAYLAHLSLEPFRFAAQCESCDGQEPLRMSYSGEGRLEECSLYPEEHALAMIRFVCPGIDASRIQLPRDDASWHWSRSAAADEKMRIYFAPTAEVLHGSVAAPPTEAAYVSVSRQHAFIGRPVVESYLQAWLSRLGVEGGELGCDFDTPSAEIEFTADAIGGQMSLDDGVVAEDLIRFARLDKALAHVSELVQIDLDAAGQDRCGVYEDGVYIALADRLEEREA